MPNESCNQYWELFGLKSTCEYWSKDGAFSDAVDTVVWTASDEGAEVVTEKIQQSVDETIEDAKQSAGTIAAGAAKGIGLLLIAGVGIYGVLQYVEAKAVKAAQ